MIIPSIDLMGGQAVQLIGGEKKAIDAGDPFPIAEKFSLAGEIAVIDLDAAIGSGENKRLAMELVRRYSCRIGGGIRDKRTALEWIDAGAARVILGTAAKPELLSQLPREKVMAALDTRNGEVVVEGWRKGTGSDAFGRISELKDLVSGFLVTFVEREGRMGGIDLARVAEVVDAARGVRVTVAGGLSKAQEIADIDRLGADVQVGMALYSGKLDLADGIAAPLKSDRPDGLFATVIVDEQGRALGLAWSNLKSIREAVRLKRGVYHSRSRGLWIKGASSGNVQELFKIDLDCDRDAIRFTVGQQGVGFCHLGTWSCWGEESDLYRPPMNEKGSCAKETAGGKANSSGRLLKALKESELPSKGSGCIDQKTADVARRIVDDIEKRGEAALRQHAETLGDIGPGDRLVVPRSELKAALDAIDPKDRALLERTKDRIASFAEAQMAALKEIDVAIPGGRAGHSISPVDRAGCYAPGGRFPLPSSVLMTAVTARTAGVGEVWVASPRPKPITLAAAALAGADGLLAVGGAQAVAAMAFGVGGAPACDVIAGPGNRYVTAAKALLVGRVGIDMLAGPSELAVLADETADPALVAADLLAQAEHDPDAIPILVSTDGSIVDKVNEELSVQLQKLSDQKIARAALENGFSVVAEDIDAAARICDRLAPEHLELHVERSGDLSKRLKHYGALFIGSKAAEVLGDYGAGPNHTLPTGGTARYSGGLSVFNFLRVRTWMKIDDSKKASDLFKDAERLAVLEGLEAHAAAAAIRSKGD